MPAVKRRRFKMASRGEELLESLVWKFGATVFGHIAQYLSSGTCDDKLQLQMRASGVDMSSIAANFHFDPASTTLALRSEFEENYPEMSVRVVDSRSILVLWDGYKVSPFVGSNVQFLKISVWNVMTQQQVRVTHDREVAMQQGRLVIEELPPGQNLSVHVAFALSVDSGLHSRINVELARCATQVELYYNQKELGMLYSMASQFVGGDAHDGSDAQEAHVNLRRISVLYRNKPEEYFDHIFSSARGLMEPYLKDANGDAANPINRCLFGLFFNGKLTSSGELPNTSPYGIVRFTIPAERLLSENNLYFADFYCTPGNEPHNVTLFMTDPQSSTENKAGLTFARNA